MSRTLIVLAVLAALTLLAQPVPAQSPRDNALKQLTTARFHAGELAQRGSAVAATRLHMHHVVNCLVGDKAAEFNAAAGHVCQGQGNGILNDLRAAQAAGVAGAERAAIFSRAALDVALKAIASNDVNESQPFAKVVAGQLQSAIDALSK